MQCHQCDGVAVEFRFLVGGLVALAEGNFVEKCAEGRLFRSFFICGQSIDQFLHAGPARLLLVGFGILPGQVVLIANLADEMRR